MAMMIYYKYIEETKASGICRGGVHRKGSPMNILFLLTPKATCAYVREEDTIRQALEKMQASGFAAVPILAKDGSYRGTLTEGDLLWALKNRCDLDIYKAEQVRIMEIAHRKDNTPVTVTAPMTALLERATKQNFIPVVDDTNTFIGIVTRRSIIKYCQQELFSKKAAT